MNKELAKTLTLALVKYIDENRPEDTMDCSSAECESIEQMLEGEHFDIVEAFIKKKLTRLTEFEQALSNYLINDFEYFHTKKWDDQKWNEAIRTQSKELIAIARKQLIKDGYVIEKKAFHDAVEKVSPEVMKEVSDNVDKENELASKHLEDYTKGYKEGYNKGYEVATKLYNEPVSYHYPEPVPPGVAYKSPQCYTDVTVTPNINSGTSTLKAEG